MDQSAYVMGVVQGYVYHYVNVDKTMKNISIYKKNPH